MKILFSILIFFIGVWGGSYLVFHAPDWIIIPTIITQAFIVVIAIHLAFESPRKQK